MKYLLAVVAALVFASCSPFGLNVAGYAEKAESLDIAWAKTSSYAYIPEDKNHWKSPKQFEEDGGGECEDFSSHLLYSLGEGEAVTVSFYQQSEKADHCIVRYRGKYIEPQCYNEYIDIEKRGWVVVDEYTWEEVMATITRHGTRKI